MTANPKEKQKYELKDKLAVLVGITSTMPIVGIPLGGRYITLFTVAFILFFAISAFRIFKKGQLSFGVTRMKRIYLLFLLWPIISYVVGIVYMPGEWHSSMTTYFIRVLEYLAITIILYVDKDEMTAKSFGNGLLIGAIANAIWSIFEAIDYYFFKQSLNDLIFGKFLSLNRDILLWNRFGGIRVSGFNYDPAHLGGILPILFCYALMKKNIYLIVLTLISLAFSQSTTALAGCLVVLFLFLLFRQKEAPKRVLSVRGITTGFVGIIAVIALVFLIGSNGTVTSFFNSISENIGGYVKRINTVYIASNNVEPREVYYTQAFGKLVERGPIVAVTGSGLGTSMYPFRNVAGLFASGSQNTVTEIETNYIAYLFDLGIIGLAFYIIFLVRGFRKLWRISKRNSDNATFLYLGVFISIICCSALYHYIFTAYQMLAFSCATIYIDYIESKIETEEFANVGLYHNA